VKIRKARVEEAPALARIAQESQRHLGCPDDWINHSQTGFSISSDLISDDSVYVAEESGELQGFYALAADGASLEQLQVAPSHLGTGVGKELFLHAMEKVCQGNN
jgi:GNAT superfamily N-acetyltransferase